MPTPRFDDVADISLTTDELLLDRIRELVGGAYRRQLWFMLLDDDDRQLPVLIPLDVPERPEPEHRVGFLPLLTGLVEELAVGSVAVILERPGPDTLSAGDRAWFAVLADASRGAGLRMRGPVLAHDHGFRWIAAEDFLEGRR